MRKILQKLVVGHSISIILSCIACINRIYLQLIRRIKKLRAFIDIEGVFDNICVGAFKDVAVNKAITLATVR